MFAEFFSRLKSDHRGKLPECFYRFKSDHSARCAECFSLLKSDQSNKLILWFFALDQKIRQCLPNSFLVLNQTIRQCLPNAFIVWNQTIPQCLRNAFLVWNQTKPTTCRFDFLHWNQTILSTWQNKTCHHAVPKIGATCPYFCTSFFSEIIKRASCPFDPRMHRHDSQRSNNTDNLSVLFSRFAHNQKGKLHVWSLMRPVMALFRQFEQDARIDNSTKKAHYFHKAQNLKEQRIVHARTPRDAKCAAPRVGSWHCVALCRGCGE